MWRYADVWRQRDIQIDEKRNIISARLLPTDWAEDNRLQQIWTVVGCSVYVGSGPRPSLVDLRVEGLGLAKGGRERERER